MEREIVFSAISLLQLDKIYVYILNEWGSKITEKFISDFRITVRKLARNPEMGIKTEFGKLSFPFKMYRIHYQFNDKVFEVAFIQDVRSNQEMINIE